MSVGKKNKYGFFSNIGNKTGDISDRSGDIITMSKSELAENTELAANTQFENRVALSKNYQVDALKKKSTAKKNYGSNLENNNDAGGGLDIEAHPELPYMGGKADQIMLPENEVDSVPDALLSQQQKDKRSEKNKKKQEKERNELSNRMKNNFKIKHTIKQAPKERYVAPPPKHTPPKLRPSGQ